MKKKIILILIALVVMIAGAVAIYSTTTSKPKPVDTPQVVKEVPKEPELSKYEVGPPTAEELLELVNAERAKVGVVPLTIDENVQKSAQLKADDMAVNQYFSHIMPSTGKVLNDEMNSLLVQSCVDSSENIRAELSENSTSQSFMDGWVKSKPHIEAIKNSGYTKTGLAIAYDKPNDRYIAVEHFCIAR